MSPVLDYDAACANFIIETFKEGTYGKDRKKVQRGSG